MDLSSQTDGGRAITPPSYRLIIHNQIPRNVQKEAQSHLERPHGMNYSIWKTMAKSDHLSSFLSILISLLFIYGFANTRWMNMIDVMLGEKTRGPPHTHAQDHRVSMPRIQYCTQILHWAQRSTKFRKYIPLGQTARISPTQTSNRHSYAKATHNGDSLPW